MTSHDHDQLNDQTGLHQRVIRQLTRVAFELSAASNLATDGVSERIDAAVEMLDEVIKELRRATFEAVTDQVRPETAPTPGRTGPSPYDGDERRPNGDRR